MTSNFTKCSHSWWWFVQWHWEREREREKSKVCSKPCRPIGWHWSQFLSQTSTTLATALILGLVCLFSTASASTHNSSCLPMDNWPELTWLAGYIPRLFSFPQTVTIPIPVLIGSHDDQDQHGQTTTTVICSTAGFWHKMTLCIKNYSMHNHTIHCASTHAYTFQRSFVILLHH